MAMPIVSIIWLSFRFDVYRNDKATSSIRRRLLPVSGKLAGYDIKIYLTVQSHLWGNGEWGMVI